MGLVFTIPSFQRISEGFAFQKGWASVWLAKKIPTFADDFLQMEPAYTVYIYIDYIDVKMQASVQMH